MKLPPPPCGYYWYTDHIFVTSVPTDRYLALTGKNTFDVDYVVETILLLQPLIVTTLPIIYR